MENLLKLPFALRLALVLAFFALFISFLLGFISGIDIGTILLRTLIFSLIFFALGYGLSVVLQRFIPELYTVIAVQTDNRQSMNIENDPDTSEPVVANEASGRYESAVDGDTETNAGNEPVYDAGLDESPSMTPASSKLGKHILEEKGFKYEPKIMAEAIRTMMSRDDS